MRQFFRVLSCGAAFAMLSHGLHAEDVAALTGSGSAGTGALAFNQAAGSLNQQSNLRALAVGSWGLALAATAGVQAEHADAGLALAAPAHASIGGDAFAGSLGAIGVNQTAGYANQSTNQLAIAISQHGEAIALTADEALLSASSAGGKAAPRSGGQLAVAISDEAFQGARGVVQVNQVAGAWNHSANLLAVRFAHSEGN